MGLVFASSFLEWSTVIIIILTYFYYYLKNAYDYWKKRGIKYVKPLLLFGNSKDIALMKKTMAEVFRDIYEEYPEEPYVGIYELVQPVLLIRDPEFLKYVLVKDFPCFQDRGVKINEKLDPLEIHLAHIGGAKWRSLRAMLSPTFTSGKMKMLFPLMKECALRLEELLDKPARNGEIMEIHESMAKFTIDVISSCIFGLQFSAVKDYESEFIKFSKRLFGHSRSFTFKLVAKSAWPFLTNLLKVKLFPTDVTDFVIKTVRENIKYREVHNIVRNDFIQLLMQLKNKGMIHCDETPGSDDVKNVLSYKEEVGIKSNEELEFTDNLMAAQILLFFTAGFETSSATITFSLYELAMNPHIQSELRESILLSLKKYDGCITYESLQQNQYLDNILKETLRKYPAIHSLSRCTSRPYVIPGTSHKLDAGQKIQIPVYGIHHDPKYYPEPERFNPDNFTPEAIAARPPFTYLPFGDGPRHCIGMRFALLETKLALAVLLSKYEFCACEKTFSPLKLDPKMFVLSALGGVWLQIKKYNST